MQISGSNLLIAAQAQAAKALAAKQPPQAFATALVKEKSGAVFQPVDFAPAAARTAAPAAAPLQPVRANGAAVRLGGQLDITV